MKVRIISLAYALLLINGGLCWSSTDNFSDETVSKSRLTICLPRDIAVENDILTLGKIAVITGEDTLAAKAGAVELGRIPAVGQVITIDRPLILSRLACSGMPACNPVITGAEKVSIRRIATVIKADSIVESASSFLSDSVREQSVARWEPVKMPADVILPANTQDFELVPRLVSHGTNGQAVTEVSITVGGKKIETRQVIFHAKYNVRRVVTVADVEDGTPLTAENTKIEEVISDVPEPANWSAPYGFIATRKLAAGTVLGSTTAKSPKPPVVIERNQNVVIKIERGGLIVTAMGKAIQEGKLGECIKVKNIDSQRVIQAKVNEDGTVEPVF